MNTPWGKADRITVLADGIMDVSTPSHGGIWLDAERIKQLPENIDNFLHDLRWWEEDCDWVIPYILFKDDIMAHGTAYNFIGNLKCAYIIAEKYHPEILNK